MSVISQSPDNHLREHDGIFLLAFIHSMLLCSSCQMEDNIRTKLREGRWAMEDDNGNSSSSTHSNHSSGTSNDRGRADERPDRHASEGETSPKSLQRRATSPARMTRTISSMNTEVLEELAIAKADVQSKQDVQYSLSMPGRPSRRNSTSTQAAASTMSEPDKDSAILCVCACFRAHIKEDAEAAEENPDFKIFNDPVSSPGFHLCSPVWSAVICMSRASTLEFETSVHSGLGRRELFH